jgi:hypothetical protein
LLAALYWKLYSGEVQARIEKGVEGWGETVEFIKRVNEAKVIGVREVCRGDILISKQKHLGDTLSSHKIYLCKGCCAQWYSAGLRAGLSGFESRQEQGNILFATITSPALGPTQSPIQRVPGAPSLGVKRPEREADHSLSSSAAVKNTWIRRTKARRSTRRTKDEKGNTRKIKDKTKTNKNKRQEGKI